MGSMLQLVAGDGFKLSAYRAEPEGKGRGAVVVVQEIFGVNSHIRSVCDGFAADGYIAIAPALFDRIRPGVELGYSPDDIAAGRELKGASSNDNALLDVAAARGAIVGSGKVGVVGYCWGGLITWLAASRLPGFACAVPYYGGGMTDMIDEAPQCPVMMHFGEHDHAIPVAGVEKLRDAHLSQQVFLYDAQHGFNCDQRGSYDAESAAVARERTLGFFRKHLG